MKAFRRVLFWIHLTTGLIAGLAIAIMAFTGVLLAFETEIVAWAERDARRVPNPADAQPLSLSELQARLRELQPELRSPMISLQNDPAAAIAFAAGRESAFYANPYTGEIRQPKSTKTREFLQLMLTWHRFLGRDGEGRPAGRLINGVCNLAFCALAVSGLYLRWPRQLSWRSVQAVARFNWRLTGRARDFNWHNTIGLWSAPILIILTLTAVPISFRWGNDLVYRLAGEQPPVRGGPPGARMAAGGDVTTDLTRPTADAVALDADAILALAAAKFPRWKQVTIRQSGSSRGPRGAEAGDARREEAPAPVTVTIREPGSWPRTASTTLTLHPYTGHVLQREGFEDLSTGRQVRTWMRFLHTGQALGWGGQLVAGLACLGGLFLVYTGFALSWRRFFSHRPPAS